MPTCWAVGCSNVSGGTENKAVSGETLSATDKISFFAFPWKDESLLKRWLTNIKRTDSMPTRRSRICSLHFSEDCFEVDYYAKLMPVSDRQRSRPKIMKPGAVPTKFAHGVRQATKIKRSSFRRRDKKQKTEVIKRKRSGSVYFPDGENGPIPVLFRPIIRKPPTTQVSAEESSKGINAHNIRISNTPELLNIDSVSSEKNHRFISEATHNINTHLKAGPSKKNASDSFPKVTSYETIANDIFDSRITLHDETITKNCLTVDENIIKVKTEVVEFEETSSSETVCTFEQQPDRVIAGQGETVTSTEQNIDDTANLSHKNQKIGSETPSDNSAENSDAFNCSHRIEAVQLSEDNTIYTETKHGVFGIPGSLHITEDEGGAPVEYVPAFVNLPPGDLEHMSVSSESQEPKKGLVYVPRSSIQSLLESNLIEPPKEPDESVDEAEESDDPEPTEEELYLHTCYAAKHDHPYTFRKFVEKSIQVTPHKKKTGPAAKEQGTKPKKRGKKTQKKTEANSQRSVWNMKPVLQL